MTIEETKQAIEVMKASTEGKTIEVSIKGKNMWYTAPSPDWNFHTCDYRVKPEPHYRPFESAEEVMEAIKKHGDWVIYEKQYYRIVAVTGASVYFGVSDEDGESFKKALENRFIDGTPFGKLVEE